jgi:hypothetical protein
MPMPAEWQCVFSSLATLVSDRGGMLLLWSKRWVVRCCIFQVADMIAIRETLLPILGLSHLPAARKGCPVRLETPSSPTISMYSIL